MDDLRLLIVVNVFEPDLGGGVLFSDLAQGLAERGIDVHVRCAYPYYPEWRDKSGENGLRITTSREHGVAVERFGLFIPRNPNSLVQRLLYEGSFFASLLRLPPGDVDVIMVFCPLMGAVGYAAIGKRLAGVPLWLNVQDIPAEAAAAGGITSGVAARIVARIQDALFNQADVWSTISPAMVEQLESRRRRDQEVLFLPNWLHRSLAEVIREAGARQQPYPQQPVRLLYSGNIGTKQDLLRFCQALHASELPFRFRIQGEGSEADSLRRWVRSTADERITMHGLSGEAELARQLVDADFFVITERSASGGSFIPSKLIPALAAETPILAVCDAESPLGREMEIHRPGPRLDWHQLGDLVELLTEVNPERHEQWRTHAAERAPFYDRERVLGLYERELRRLAARRSRTSGTHRPAKGGKTAPFANRQTRPQTPPHE